MTFKEGDVFENGNVRLYLRTRDSKLQLWKVIKVRRWPWTKCWSCWDTFEESKRSQWWSDADLAKRISKFTKVNG